MSNKTVGKFTHLGTGVAGLFVLLVIIGAVITLVSNLRLRADLTAEKLYTLSTGTHQLLGKLDHDVTLKYYFSTSSEEMPMGLKNYAAKVRDLLKEYEIAGKGRIHLEAYDPKPDSDAEEWAQRYGVEPQQITPFGQPAYFGLVAVCGDTDAPIPGFSPRGEATLEYDITRLITRVAWPEKPVLGVMSSLSVLGTPQNPMALRRRSQTDLGWTAFSELRSDYTVREVSENAESIDADIKTLLVIHPKQLSEKTQFAIDQFVLKGGRLMVFVDPLCIADFEANSQTNPMQQQSPNAPGPSSLDRLFNAWGIHVDSSKIVADMSLSTSLNVGNGKVEKNPTFLSLDSENLAGNDLLTAQLTTIMMPFATAISDETSEDVTFNPLMTTSKENDCLIDAMSVQYGMASLNRELNPDGVQRVLAARLKGKFKTAFPGGMIGSETNAVPDALESGESTVVIFGDVDMLYDRFCAQAVNSLFGVIAQPINDNLTLFANTVEQLSGTEELIGVRSRGKSNRPFKKVDELEVKATRQWQAEEERLETALQETQQRLSELQSQKTGSERLILSKEQQDELDQFRTKQSETRRELKNVRKNLNREIERLGITLKVINIGLIPLIVISFGIIHGMRRRKRN